MKTRAILSLLVFVMMISAFCQPTTIELNFTAIDNEAYVQLDSVKFMNRTQGSESIIYWPDTTMMVDINLGDQLLYIGYANVLTGIHPVRKETESFQLFQNFPNPVRDMSVIKMYVPQKATVETMVTDMQGRLLSNSNWNLEQGNHSFRFTRGNDNFYFFTARWNGTSQSIKILATGPETGNSCSLGYIGIGNDEPFLKASAQTEDLVLRQSGILDNPETNENYTFQFATNIPCPGIPTVEYAGQVYNTIQIFSQCWLKENLNVGTMIPLSQNMTDNGIMEKYCYDNDIDNCSTYGGLYIWDEMMQYTTQLATQGICPTGWHVATDDEWSMLEGSVDSQYGIGDPIWDEWLLRGYNAGTNLKSTEGWNSGGNGTDDYGFLGLPAGGSFGGIFFWINEAEWWWTSNEGGNTANAWGRRLKFDDMQGYRYGDSKNFGSSIRCIKNDSGTATVWSCGDPIIDIDSNTYNTVQIGDQCWMKENLKTATYSNGTSIPNVTDGNAWSNLTTGAYVWYDNDISWKD